jgi:hypothetical protein
MMEDLSNRTAMIDPMTAFITSPMPTRDNTAFFRYSDKVIAPEEIKHIFQHPRGEKLRRSESNKLFKHHKTDDHWAQVSRSKSYLAHDYFPPVTLHTSNLIDLFEQNQDWKLEESSEEYQKWREDLIQTIPKLNFDAIIELNYYMSFKAKINDKYIWRAIEEGILENFHLYDLKHTC